MQKVPEAERNIQTVHEINLKQNEIFVRTLEWMAQIFNDSKSVVEISDRENGKIIGKGITDITHLIINIPCQFTMIVEVKDGKYRTSYNNFIGMWGEYKNDPRPVEYQKDVEALKIKLTEMDNNLFSYLSSAKVKENW